MRSWLPEGVSSYSGVIDDMFFVILWVTGIAFILTEALLFYFAWRYRRREGVRASYTHGNTTLEVIWTVVPAVLLVFLALASNNAWTHIRMTAPDTDEIVLVTAKQFAWEVRYRGADGEFETADDVVLDNEMRLPQSRPMRIRLRSRDVLHSFFVPAFRLKQDAVPGVSIDVWVQPDKAGTYEIACAELCGFGHYNMRGVLTVLDQEAYGAWVAESQAAVAAAQAPPA